MTDKDNINKIKRIILLLELVLKDKLKAKDAIAEWPNIDQETDDDIKNAWHELYHYYIDEDIRSKDNAYDKYQRDLLNSYITDLRGKIVKS